MNNSQIKAGTIKLQIQINQHVKFGKIAYKQDDIISKVFNDLKKIKILPDRINQYEIKYFDRNNAQINKSSLFCQKFDSNSDVNLLKISVPQGSINLQESAKKADQYIKSNKEKKRQMKQLSEAQNFVKNLKPIFSLIHQQKYNQVSNLCDSQEYSVIIKDYSNEHKQIVLTNKIYESILNQIIEEKYIDTNKLKELKEIKSPFGQNIQRLIKKHNSSRDQQEQLRRLVMIKKDSQSSEKISQLNQEIQKLKLTLKRREIVIKDLQNQLKQKQADYQQYQRDSNQKISTLQLQIEQLKNDLLRNEINYQKQLQNKQKEIDKMNVTLPKQLKVSEHLTQYFKYFINKHLVLNSIALHPQYANQLIQVLSNHIPSQIKGINLIYKYEKPLLSDRFHHHTNYQKNILVIAQTKQGRIFGGFSNLPFDPQHRKHSPNNILNNVKSFLFNIYQNQLNFFPIKPNYDSVCYDPDFIVFGNEEICIDFFNQKVESLFVNYKYDYLHYQDVNGKRNYFLSDKGQNKGQLKNCQIYQIVT